MHECAEEEAKNGEKPEAIAVWPVAAGFGAWQILWVLR